MWLSKLGTATQERFDPLDWNSITTVHRSEESSSNGGIRVCVAATHDSINYSLFQTRGMKKLPQRIPKSDKNPMTDDEKFSVRMPQLPAIYQSPA